MTSLDEAVYRDSGLPWVGPIPSEWQTVPLMSIAVERNEKNGGMLENNLLSLSYGRIVRKDIEANDGLLPESFETYQIVHPGDVVFRLTDLQNDKRSLRTALVEERGIITSAYLAVRAVEVQPNYLGYLLRSYDLSKVFYSMGGGLRQSMRFDDLKRLPLVLPSIDEQTAIAAFLDRETAKIDALVEEQKRLIDLLKEKRQAVISHAVTKGLNPDAPMKDSGIEWLGEVPEHWEVVQLGRCFRSMVYGISEALAPEGAVAILRMGNIQDGAIDLRDLKYVDSVDDELLLEEDDLLYNRTNSLELIGKVGRYIPEGGEPVSFASYLVRLRAHVDCSSLFLSYALNTDGILGAARSRAFVSIGQCNLNPTRYSEIAIAKPPLDEQLTIAGFLGEAVGAIDEMSTQAKKSIDLLNERRSALISAAVTGKIDVRRFAQTREAAE